MSQEPKRMDRRKFMYAGLGALVVIFGGLAAYFATKPPEVIKETIVKTVSGTPTTVVRTISTTVEKPVEKVITTTIEKPVEKTIVTTVAGTPTTIVKTERVVTTIEKTITPVEAPHIAKAKEKAKLIDWNTPKVVDRVLKPGEVADVSKYSGYGVTLKGKGMISGYQLPKGWDKATAGVKRLVATNSGGLKHDPATVLNAKLFEEWTGIHIEIIEMKDSLLWPKTLSVATAKSTDVDIFYSSNPYEIPQLAEAKWIVPVDEFWPPDVQEHYPKKMFPALQGLDKRFYGSPLALWGMFLFYRPSWFKKAGLKVPRTWQELIPISKELDKWAKANLGEGYSGAVFSAKVAGMTRKLIEMLVYSQDKRLVQDGKLVIDKDAWNLMCDLWLKGGFSESSLEYDWPDAPEVFAKGKAGMTITGGVYMKMYTNPEFAGAIQGDWDVVPLPGWEGITEVGKGSGGNDAWLINPFIAPEKVAAAMLWLDFYRSFQGCFNELYYEGNESFLPAVYEHPEVKKEVMHTDYRKLYMATAVDEVFPPGVPEAMDAMTKYFHKVVLKEIDRDKALEQLQKEINQII
jgi:ABC-type glycerol-3-phosphate transport system substrate-binding protein